MKKKKMKALSVLIFTCLTLALYPQKSGVVISDKKGWHKIAETVVDFTHDTDYVGVVGADRFAAIKIKVEKSPVYIESCDVFFEIGDMQSMPVKKELKAAGETEVVHFKGGERTIKNIRLVYKTAGSPKDKRARVEVWGLKTNPDKGKPK